MNCDLNYLNFEKMNFEDLQKKYQEFQQSVVQSSIGNNHHHEHNGNILQEKKGSSYENYIAEKPLAFEFKKPEKIKKDTGRNFSPNKLEQFYIDSSEDHTCQKDKDKEKENMNPNKNIFKNEKKVTHFMDEKNSLTSYNDNESVNIEDDLHDDEPSTMRNMRSVSRNKSQKKHIFD